MTLSQPQSSQTSELCFKALDEPAMVALANQLACLLKRGDTIFLKGTLGAGKSTMARAIIRSVAIEPDLEVQSPTFPLLIPYETNRAPISHYDLYRLGSVSELEELGLYDQLAAHLTLIEWPEQLAENTIRHRLEIEISECDAGHKRTVHLKGHGEMAAKIARFGLMHGFLNGTDWQSANWIHLQGDASTRSYIRLVNGDVTALFMNAPPQPDGPAVKNGKPYSQIAHLAEDMTSFVAISETLGAAGFALPRIIKAELEEGFLLISDFGNDQYHHLITQKGQDIKTLYDPAIETLARLRQIKPGPMPVKGKTYHLPPFDKDALFIEVELLLNWYWPYVKKQPCPKPVSDQYEEIWSDLYTIIHNQDSQHWMLRDYHSPNIMYLSGREGHHTVGIIDFQDALVGNAAYDVASLCQDARLTINRNLQLSLLDHYIGAVKQNDPAFDETSFKRDFAILCAQRACKLLGIFIRLNERDNKPQYLAHLPRIWGYLEESLPHPQLAALKIWFDTHFPTTLRTAYFQTSPSDKSEKSAR